MQPLAIVLLLLSFGLCLDAAAFIQHLPVGVKVLAGVLLAGRIAAIGGILVKTRLGWFLAVGYCAIWIVLNLASAAQGAHSLGLILGLALPGVCLGILFWQRAEFA